MKKNLFLALVLFSSAASVSAASIYSEDFETSSNTSVSAFDWTAYQNDGTNRSTSTADPLYVLNSSTVGLDRAFIGSGSSNLGQRFALISDAAPVNLADWQSDLTISFTHNAQDQGTQESATMGWRVLVTVGGTIYASDFIGRSTTTTTSSVTVADSVWREWTGETNLSDGFDIADISGTAGTISGTISNIGLLAIDGTSNNDYLQLWDFSISATAIPEPSAALLGGLGLLALLRRRRA